MKAYWGSGGIAPLILSGEVEQLLFVRTTVQVFSQPRIDLSSICAIGNNFMNNISAVMTKNQTTSLQNVTSQKRANLVFGRSQPPPVIMKSFGVMTSNHLKISLERTAETFCMSHVRGCIQKFPDWPPGARIANGTALCH
jgi:hypothetical protein